MEYELEYLKFENVDPFIWYWYMVLVDFGTFCLFRRRGEFRTQYSPYKKVWRSLITFCYEELIVDSKLIKTK